LDSLNGTIKNKVKMNRQILKFTMKVNDSTSVEMTKGSEVLSVITHNNLPMICVLSPMEGETETRHFESFNTGVTIGSDMGIERKFIGTAQINNGAIEAHVFERIN
jgi:hypothetical protein